MKICQAHWDELKQALDERGLMRLISGSGEKATKMIEGQLQGNDSNETYDPLLAANFSIWSNALSVFGLDMMAGDAPCPLCLKTETEANCTDPNCNKQTGSDWIRFAADEQLENARQRKLVPPIQ